MNAVVGFALELHVTVYQRENRVVAAETDIGAGLPTGAALADDDVAGNDRLAAVFLHAEAAAFRIAPVAG